MNWTSYDVLHDTRVEWKSADDSAAVDDSTHPNMLDTEFHVVMVILPDAGTDGIFRLGNSAYGADIAANASYNEVRIRQGALSSETLETNHTDGPDATL